MTQTTISIEPNYEGMFDTFLHDAKGRFETLRARLARQVRDKKPATITLSDLHGVWGSLAMAAQTTVDTERLTAFREFVSDALAELNKLSLQAQDLEDEE